MVGPKPFITVLEAQDWANDEIVIRNHRPPMGVNEFNEEVEKIIANHAPGSKSAKAAASMLVIRCLRLQGFADSVDKLLELRNPAQEQVTNETAGAALAVVRASEKESK
ncbi:MAG: hypothetical protein V3T82_08045 [Nitrospinaceae bacterium]